MKIKKMLGHKTLRCTYATTSSRERDELGQELHLRSQFAYMSRVRRKESPKTHSQIPRKSDWNFENLKSRQIAGVEQVLSTPNVE